MRRSITERSTSDTSTAPINSGIHTNTDINLWDINIIIQVEYARVPEDISQCVDQKGSSPRGDQEWMYSQVAQSSPSQKIVTWACRLNLDQLLGLNGADLAWRHNLLLRSNQQLVEEN